MGNWRIGKIKIAEMEETDPEVYRGRAHNALCDGQYHIAIQEIEMALKYSNNEMQDHIRMAEIIYKMQEYERCFEYIHQHKIVDYFFEEYERYDCTGFTVESGVGITKFFEFYLECWKHIGCSLDETDVIIVVADGTGMVKSLQSAIDMESQHHRIYIKNTVGEGEVIGIVERKELCIIIDDSDGYDRKIWKSVGKKTLNIIINSGNVHIKNSQFFLDDYSVGIEVNGGNVLLESTEFSGKLHSIGLYVKNPATIDIKDCKFSTSGVGIFAECGEINVINTRFSGLDHKYKEYNYNIVVMGKKGKAFLKIIDCGRTIGYSGKGALLAGYNTDTQIRGSNWEKCWITLEGKLQNDGQNEAQMNIYNTRVENVSSYNGGTVYLHNVDILGLKCLEADNGKIFGENCRNESIDITLRMGAGKDTEIICDCTYEVNNKVRNECRMGQFLNEVKWLLAD